MNEPAERPLTNKPRMLFISIPNWGRFVGRGESDSTNLINVVDTQENSPKDYGTSRAEQPQSRRVMWRERAPSWFRQSFVYRPGRRGLTTDFRGFAFESSRGALKLYALCCLGYISISVIAFSFVFERWSIIDAVYFALVTFTTTGFGDLVPSTEGGRIFTTFFVVFGVIMLGVFVGIVGHSISEAHYVTMKRKKKGRQLTMLQSMYPDYLKTAQDGETQESESVVQDIKHVVWKSFPLLLIIALFACIIGAIEGWPVSTSMYFCAILSTTTGYGDVVPTSQWTKLYCILYLPLAVGVFAEILGRVAGIYIQHKMRAAEHQFLRRAMTLCDIRTMDTNHNGHVSMSEWLSFMLVALQKVDKEFIDELKMVFTSLDANGNGVLDFDDLVAAGERGGLCSNVSEESLTDDEERHSLHPIL